MRAASIRLEKFGQTITNTLKINLSILMILCVVAQHSFVIKFAGIFLVCMFNLPSFRSFSLKKIPAFYFIIIVSEIIKFAFLNESYSVPHLSQFVVGMVYWVSSLLLCWILFWNTSKGQYVNESIAAFTVLNFVFSVCQYVKVCVAEGVINPYNTGHNHPYGISSGDLINGLFHGVHLTNAFVSVFLVLFYIYANKRGLTLLALTTLLLTGSNYATIIFFVAAAVLFFTGRLIAQRWTVVGVSGVIVLFYVFVSPLNAEYLIQKTLHISATLPNSSRDIERENLDNARGYREEIVADTNMPYDVAGITAKRVVVKSNEQMFNFVKQPGKSRSFFQTKDFLVSSVPHFLFGSGMGGFSSKLAFNSSGVMEGSALNRYLPVYETDYFRNNHKAIYAYLKTQHIMFHSESNRPFSVYNQLSGEYGVVGLLAFFIFYLWFFLKRMRWRTYALPMFVALLFILNIDYFIESLSILLFFELLMFMDGQSKNSLPDAD